MNNEGDLLQEDSRDDGNETEASRINKLRRTRKKVTKPHISSTEMGEMDISNSKDNTSNNTQIPTAPQLSSRMKHIKQEMTKNHLQFVRFEATDLHGVSRSKSIPAHFFQEKVIHGVFMPRGYLELIPNPKDNEVDHIRATCFNSDIVLMPELSTFRVLPWAERTARVICDTFTVTVSGMLVGRETCSAAVPELSSSRSLGKNGWQDS
ncbi:lengsin, lens protein with glutamine synthetase domain [Rhinolophus ferrumequinum]|uniref:Lengsin, lens protein with glutamine synthetase domain n=1 Tax=Rhinolophus ferrumequinum TaxID=59479 RepID=A0A671EIE4_RHIFE|nr:lengsin isoform X2 [Rhinolophus ferrumequinum]KAF6364653.1 lengsin, lens protein with glutamine synthetase domain [Rhinolophus ferrumequinum]